MLPGSIQTPRDVRASSRARRTLLSLLLCLAACGPSISTLYSTEVPAPGFPAAAPGEPAPASQPLGRVELPPPGEAAIALLDDGLPVWVVRDQEGTARVLAIATNVRPYWGPWVDGAFTQVIWNSARRCFLGARQSYAEDGRMLGYEHDGLGHTSDAWLGTEGYDLIHYRTTPDPASPAHLVVHEPVAGARRTFPPDRPSTCSSIVPSSSVAGGTPEELEQRAVDLASALALPAGRWAVVRAALVLATGQPARICSPPGSRCAPCDPSAPLAPEVRPTREPTVPACTMFNGPLLVRRAPDGLRGVTLLGGGVSSQAM